jgi:hypothetical protein
MTKTAQTNKCQTPVTRSEWTVGSMPNTKPRKAKKRGLLSQRTGSQFCRIRFSISPPELARGLRKHMQLEGV